MTTRLLQQEIERHFAAGPSAIGEPSAMTAFLSLRAALECGEVRAASPDAASPTGWRVNTWVKQGILLGFRLGVFEESAAGRFSFVDKHTYPVRHFGPADGVRIVPGGSSIRAGAYVARGVVCMPPMYINAGAFVDEGTMVDSHALVGSCAQVGKRVHLSAAAQIGGVLEPVKRVRVLRDAEPEGEGLVPFAVAAPNGVERGGFDGFEALGKARAAAAWADDAPADQLQWFFHFRQCHRLNVPRQAFPGLKSETLRQAQGRLWGTQIVCSRTDLPARFLYRSKSSRAVLRLVLSSRYLTMTGA